MNGDLGDDDLRPLLRGAVGPLEEPDVGRIRRRARQLAALRIGAVASGAAVLIAGVVGAGLALGSGDVLDLPVIDDPAEDDAAPTDGTLAGCPPPNLWPTVLPWVDQGQTVPPPDLIHYGTDADPNGRLVWAADPDAFDTAGFSDTDVVVVARLHDHEPFGGDVPEVEVRGRTAQLMWIGDPGVGELQLVWSEGNGPCDTYAVGLTILSGPSDGDGESEPDRLLGSPTLQPERAPGEGRVTYLQRVIEHAIEGIADSLEEGASAEAADADQMVVVPPRGEVAATFVDDHPVFVVHEDTGAVRVLDAVNPHDAAFPKVLAYCRTSGWFEDLWHGSQFDQRGDWMFATAPTGLAPYTIDGVDGTRLVVGERLDAPPRRTFEDHPGPRGPNCGPRTALYGPNTTYEEGALDDLVVHDPSEIGGRPGDAETDLWFPTRERIRGELPREPSD
jgi:hypothetical protein